MARSPSRAHLAAVLEGGLVAVVTVGDHAGPCREEGLDPGDPGRVRDPREAVAHAARIARAPDLPRLERGGEQRTELVLRIFVEQEHAREIRLGGAQLLEAIGLRAGERPLVGPHDAGGVLLERERSEEADPLEGSTRRRDITLTHHVVGRIAIVDQNALGPPGVEDAPHPAVIRRRFVGHVARQLESDRVVGIAVEEARALVRGDHVVGRHDHRGEIDAPCVVANGSERSGDGHRSDISSRKDGAEAADRISSITARAIAPSRTIRGTACVHSTTVLGSPPPAS